MAAGYEYVLANSNQNSIDFMPPPVFELHAIACQAPASRGYRSRRLRCIASVASRHRQDHARSEEHTSELQSLMRISYAVFCLKKKTTVDTIQHTNTIETNKYNTQQH